MIITAVGYALKTAFGMFWEILWPLVLGFTLSGVVQALVPHRTMSRYLGCEGPRCLTFATLFGAASSSCSYAAVALARSLFRRGASFTSAMVFELASTNLVFELGIVLIILLGWQFTAAEFAGGIVMAIILALIFRLTLTRTLLAAAKAQAEQGVLGSMEGHATMDMSVTGGSFWQKLLSGDGFTAVANYFVMDWAAIWKDIAIGLLIAGALAAWVPERFWQDFFLTSHPTLAKLEGPLVGPLVAMVSFVCSVGNVPLAAVLWRGGISFGGVVSFIFADLIILPILDIYRRYYGWKTAFYILATFYATMAIAGYVVELVFGAFGRIPTNRSVARISEGISFNYTSVLDVLFLLLAAVLVWRFVRTGGLPMLGMMDEPLPDVEQDIS